MIWSELGLLTARTIEMLFLGEVAPPAAVDTPGHWHQFLASSVQNKSVQARTVTSVSVKLRTYHHAHELGAEQVSAAQCPFSYVSLFNPGCMTHSDGDIRALGAPASLISHEDSLPSKPRTAADPLVCAANLQTYVV